MAISESGALRVEIGSTQEPVSTRTAPVRDYPLHAFTGDIVPRRPGALYTLGLAIVAFAMVLLPLVYIGLIGLAAWAVYLHLRYDVWLLQGSGGGLFRLIGYLGPAIAGVILVFFMIKPFFAKKAKAPELITLTPEEESLLFSFVRRICILVGARPPCRIDVDCQVNASASLRNGLWSRDLVLTIGLPLVAGLNMREFAGVLSHEFGHFAQGAGMRLTYVVRQINYWFARVVYERDEWDEKLESGARESDWRLAIILHAARGCVWMTRRILWVLMHAGHAISCFMLRQMEYDADSYEAKLAGSDTFESTAARLRLLNVASQVAYEDVRQSWAANRLPENLPLLVELKRGALSPETQQKITAAAAEEKTGWFHTHPCDTDRVRAVARLAEPGVFRLTEPATDLFSNFAETSRRVTLHQYRTEFELAFAEANLMSAEEILREAQASTEAVAMIREFYGEVNITLIPLIDAPELEDLGDEASARSLLQSARQKMKALRDEAEKLSAQWGEEQERLINFVSARCLAGAGFLVDPKAFGLPTQGASSSEQEGPASRAAEQSSARIRELTEQLKPFVSAIRQRVTAGLWITLQRTPAESPETQNIRQQLELLAALGAELPNLHALGCQLTAFGLLGQNASNHSNQEELHRKAQALAGELNAAVAGLQERLKDYPYPFAHARSSISVAAYAQPETPASHEFERAHASAATHVDRLFTLHYRLLAKILATARERSDA